MQGPAKLGNGHRVMVHNVVIWYVELLEPELMVGRCGSVYESRVPLYIYVCM
jgi:hypothetical protein